MVLRYLTYMESFSKNVLLCFSRYSKTTLSSPAFHLERSAYTNSTNVLHQNLLKKYIPTQRNPEMFVKYYYEKIVFLVGRVCTYNWTFKFWRKKMDVVWKNKMSKELKLFWKYTLTLNSVSVWYKMLILFEASLIEYPADLSNRNISKTTSLKVLSRCYTCLWNNKQTIFLLKYLTKFGKCSLLD